MATLRLTLYANDFTTLDSVDVPVTGAAYQGAGSAAKTARDHFWSNHVQDDLDILLASRKSVMDAAEALLMSATTPPLGVVGQGVVEALKGALQEAKMVDEIGLPKAVREDLEKKMTR